MRLKFQKGDFLAIGLVVLLAAAVAMLFLPRFSQSAARAEVYQDGKLVQVLPLSKAGSYTISGQYTNVITVQQGKVAITSSDCPGEDCVHTGRIGSVGRSIVCLPNGVEVRIAGESADVDFVVG